MSILWYFSAEDHTICGIIIITLTESFFNPGNAISPLIIRIFYGMAAGTLQRQLVQTVVAIIDAPQRLNWKLNLSPQLRMISLRIGRRMNWEPGCYRKVIYKSAILVLMHNSLFEQG